MKLHGLCCQYRTVRLRWTRAGTGRRRTNSWKFWSRRERSGPNRIYEFFRGRMRILLVDDDDALMSFIAKEMENRGCDVHQSSSGDEAFRVWQRLGPWELVLTDYRFFPGTKIRDGAQLAAAILGVNSLQTM